MLGGGASTLHEPVLFQNQHRRRVGSCRCSSRRFNPIEQAFAKLKAFLRAARPRSFDHVCALMPAAGRALRISVRQKC
jgi:hypothetical protein